MKNFLIIASLIIFGWEASVPLVYFAAQGSLNTALVLTAAIGGNVVSDTFWYIVGRKITHERIGQTRYFRNKPNHYAAVGRAMRKRGYLFLFCSKFLYGFGIPAHILSGAYRMPYLKTLAVNIFGTVFWTLFVFGLAKGAQEIPSLQEDIVVAQLVFGAFVVLMFVLHLGIGKVMKKVFRLNSTDSGEKSE